MTADLDCGEPPHDLAAEQAALGALLGGAPLTDVELQPQQFYRPAHQLIYRVIQALGSGDPIMVHNELRARGESARTGAAPYLHDLMTACPAVVNAAHYARIVAEMADRRTLIETAAQIGQRAQDPAAAVAVIQADARAQLDGHSVASDAAPFTRLDELLSEPQQEITWRIEGLMPAGGRTVLAAQFKAGKTTLVGNLVRCLADGTPFLGRYSVAPVGDIAVIDTEMPRATLQAWLRDQAIGHPERIRIATLRGAVSSFDIADPARRAAWARWLRGAGLLILDCIGPVLAGLGLDENKALDVGQFLAAFDHLLRDATVPEAAITHHMGHLAERSRGASRLRDWPDAEWKLIRERDEDGEPAPNAKRFFSALGRDVEQPEKALEYDPASRHLVIAGGSRHEARMATLAAAAIAYVGTHSEADCSQNMIESSLEGRRPDVRAAITQAIKDGHLCMHPAGRAHLHRVREKCPDHNPTSPIRPLFAQDLGASSGDEGADGFAHSPIGGRTIEHPSEGERAADPLAEPGTEPVGEPADPFGPWPDGSEGAAARAAGQP